MKRMITLMLMAIFVVSMVGEGMAATKTQTRSKTRTPSSTCVPRT